MIHYTLKFTHFRTHLSIFEWANVDFAKQLGKNDISEHFDQVP